MEKSLFKISEEYLDIISQLEEGEITPELEDQLKITREELEKKGINYCFMIRNLESKINMVDSEIQRISNLRKDLEYKHNKLKETLLQALLMFGKEDKLTPKQKAEGKEPVKRLEFGTFRLSTRRSVSTKVTSDFLIDDKYKKANLTVKDLTIEDLRIVRDMIFEKGYKNLNEEEKIMKTSIKEDIDKGIEVEGAELETNYSLTIK